MAKLNVTGNLKVNALDSDTKQMIFDLVYPVGTYLAIDNPNFDTVDKVNAYYGGQWEQIVDKVLYGVSSGAGVDTGNNNPIIPVPKHSHNFQGNNISGHVGGTDIESFVARGDLNQGGCLSFSDWNWTKYSGHTNGAQGYSARTINFNATPTGSILETGTDGATLDVRGARRTTYIYHRLS